MKISCNLNYIQQEFWPLAKANIRLISSLAIMIGTGKLTDAIYSGYKASGCKSAMQNSVCASYTGIGVVSNVVLIIATWQLVKLAWTLPSLMASGPPQAQPNAFFQSQQNGGLARYAEDDLQGTHRKPLRNYEPVRWSGGSQSI